MFGFYKPSYILLIPTLIFVIIEAIEAWLVYYYNRYCTNRLLANGYYPEENDEYSIALLKEFTYIPYTKEELEDKSIREKYKKFSNFARKEERDNAGGRDRFSSQGIKREGWERAESTGGLSSS